MSATQLDPITFALPLRASEPPMQRSVPAMMLPDRCLPRRLVLAKAVVASQLVAKPPALRVLEAVIGLSCLAAATVIARHG